MKNSQLKKTLFIFSVISFLYFVFLVIYSNNFSKNNVLNAIAEMLTIPFLIIIIINLIFSFFIILQEKFNLNSLSILTFLLSLTNLVFLYYFN